MIHLIKACVIAFSIYSNIPVVQFEWKEEDMKYMLCFFPWIGALIGACLFAWKAVCDHFGIGATGYALVGAAIPLFITGGFHVDGFMDTMDAFHSYRPREKKLEILKDSHIGAFAVIMLAGYGLLYLGAFSEIMDTDLLLLVCAGFFLSRCLSGIAVLTFPGAKKDGSLQMFAQSAAKKRTLFFLIMQGILCVAFMLWQSFYAGICVTAGALLAMAYYYRRTKKELGGITGDTAGYFVLLCEICMVIVAAVIQIGFR